MIIGKYHTSCRQELCSTSFDGILMVEDSGPLIWYSFRTYWWLQYIVESGGIAEMLWLNVDKVYGQQMCIAVPPKALIKANQ